MSAFTINRSLSRGDIQFSDQSAILSIKHSKTIQFGDRVLRIPLPEIKGSALCPVSALQKLLTVQKLPQTAPLFSFVKDDGLVCCITHSIFTRMLKRILDSCGLDAKLYSGHSFRRGGASFAFSCGVPATVIKLQGDWKSSAYEAYISNSLDYRQKLSRVLALQLG